MVTNFMSLPGKLSRTAVYCCTDIGVGTDLDLMDTTQKFLEAVGCPTIVSAGKQVFAEVV